MSEAGVSAECVHCGYRLGFLVIERQDRDLLRCPKCGAYDWRPEPTNERREIAAVPEERGG